MSKGLECQVLFFRGVKIPQVVRVGERARTTKVKVCQPPSYNIFLYAYAKIIVDRKIFFVVSYAY